MYKRQGGRGGEKEEGGGREEEEGEDAVEIGGEYAAGWDGVIDLVVRVRWEYKLKTLLAFLDGSI